MSVSGLIYDSIENILYICFRFELWFYRDHSIYMIQVREQSIVCFRFEL